MATTKFGAINSNSQDVPRVEAAVNPTATDDSGDGYSIGTIWVNTTADTVWFCVDASVGAAVWKDISAGAGGGEANTASNVGVGGVGIFKQKTGVDLEFKNVNAGSSKITVANDAGNNEVDIDADANAIVAASTDSRLSDARTPTAHATSHQAGGSDTIKLDDLAAPDDNTDLNASASAHGLMQKYPGGTSTFLRADGAFAAPSVAATFPQGHIYDLTMSNAADAANDITVAVGECVDDGGTENMVLASAITKQIDAAWAVGTNQGGMNTGAVANDTWYEVHLIKRTDTGVVDVMFTTTANRSTLPTNYTKKRRIGWVRRATATNLAFTQVGSYITLTTPQNDVSATATASATTRTLTAAPSTIARFRASCLGNTAVNAANAIVFSELVETDTAPTTTNGFNSIGSGDFAIQGAGHIELRVNSSSQIRDRAITATGSMAYDISTFGWIDDRGRESGA